MLGTYTVQSSDTLSGIARRQLGDARRWPESFLLNRGIRHPDRISPGQVLTLPVDTPTQPPSPLHRPARRHPVGHRPARAGRCQPLAGALGAQP
jgi:murein DD-endopeptidase MepM/ murein hydrolase activator NlpD